MNRIEILVPDLPESVLDATVACWHKKQGDYVKRDEVLVEIETDKVILEVSAVDSGILESILEKEGSTVSSKQLLGRIHVTDAIQNSVKQVQLIDSTENIKSSSFKSHASSIKKDNNDSSLTPAIRRLIAEHDLNPSDVIKESAEKGRLTRDNIEKYVNKKESTTSINIEDKNYSMIDESSVFARCEKRVAMTRLRKRIAERLLDAKNSTATLTTFNEVNMKAVSDLRKTYGDHFEKKYGVRLGLMSFYVKAVIEALKCYPEVNASIDGSDIVYHNYFDISIAVATTRGLVTPVLRDADTLSMADIEKNIKELASQGRDGKLTIEKLKGGNFTITNGGVFGSLMSTPIINPPQSAILGIHAIKDRPMAVDGKVEILPMMYLALSYDHRLIDGRESVGFLMIIKNILEDPNRLLLEI
ncbi:2-oxoglutarate dehydrogenase complex dihydrolipoyllysine-residue succinyltransferase [Arsenophonus symbiont of Ornithomya chloropus]|uniref:2-oxoglutarate dehydrogenase complex dihydrolipoyllysine-residue succinyltransferase n=1 Tax=Arsenophonus symbiont of Ornithomya chloropus TaxID=634121 RepID=UPI0032B26650